jgi:hypothetical protein
MTHMTHMTHTTHTTHMTHMTHTATALLFPPQQTHLRIYTR